MNFYGWLALVVIDVWICMLTAIFDSRMDRIEAACVCAEAPDAGRKE